MPKIFIRPAPGRMVRDPRTMKPLPESGKSVERTPFWIRRLKAGDVVSASAAAPITRED